MTTRSTTRAVTRSTTRGITSSKSGSSGSSISGIVTASDYSVTEGDTVTLTFEDTSIAGVVTASDYSVTEGDSVTLEFEPVTNTYQWKNAADGSNIADTDVSTDWEASLTEDPPYIEVTNPTTGRTKIFRVDAPIVVEPIPPLPGTLLARYIAGEGDTYDGSLNMTQWDDVSGNDYHATPVDTNKPRARAFGGARVAWDIALDRPVTTAWAGGIEIPEAASFDKRNCLFLIVARRGNSALNQSYDAIIGGSIGFDASSQDTFLTGSNIADAGFYIWPSGPVAGITQAVLTTSPLVFAVHGHAAGTDFYWGPRRISSASLMLAETAGGLILGRGISDSYVLRHNMYEAAFIADLTQAEALEWVTNRQAYWDFAGTGVKDRTLVLAGNSIIAGEPWYTDHPVIAEQIAQQYPNAHVCSIGVNGTTLAGTGNDLGGQITYSSGMGNSALAPGESSHPFTNRILVIQSGTNDIAAGDSAATIRTAYTTRVTEAHAAGFTHVAVMQIPDATSFDAGKDAVRSSVNADIDSLEFGHDIAIEIDTRFNDATANVDGVFEDEAGLKIHPSYTGSQVLTANILTAIGSLLA